MSDPVAGVAGALTVDLADSLDALTALKPDYESLCAACGNTSPFALHEWHTAWCEHFLNLDPQVSDRLSILALRNGAGVCVALIPLVVSRRRIGPLKIGSVDLLGADPSTTESRTPLVLKGYEDLAVQAVRRRLAGEFEWDWINWRNLSGAFADALARGARTLAVVEAPGYVLGLAPTWEQFRAGLKRNIRESLRHCYNSLKRDGLEYALEIATEPADVERAIDEFLALHALRADMTGTVPHPNHFASGVSQRFLHSVCGQLASRGAVRIFQLRIGDRIVAVRIGFVVGDCLYLYYSGFDPAWARYSVMTTTVAEAIKDAISRGLKTVNLSRGTDPSKTRWGPRTIEYRGIFERRDRLVSKMAHRFFVSAHAERGIPSWLLRRLGKAPRVWR